MNSPLLQLGSPITASAFARTHGARVVIDEQGCSTVEVDGIVYHWANQGNKYRGWYTAMAPMSKADRDAAKRKPPLDGHTVAGLMDAKRLRTGKAKCSTEGCRFDAYAKGVCKTCYLADYRRRAKMAAQIDAEARR